MNFDAAEAENRGIGAIYWDHRGEVLAAATWKVAYGTEARIPEGLGMRLAMLLATNLYFTKSVIESDYSKLITSVHSKQDHVSYFHSLVEDCQAFKNALQSCSLRHVKRVGNQAADSLAKLACTKGECIWVKEYLNAIAPLVIGDCTYLHQVE